MSAEILAGVNALTGVVGSALVDAEGRCTLFALPAPYEPMLVSMAVAMLKEVLDHFATLDEAPQPRQFFLGMSGLDLVVRWAGDAAFVVLATPQSSAAMLTVALNAAALKLAAAGGPAPQTAPPQAVPRPPPLPAATLVAASPSTPLSAPPVPPPALKVTTWGPPSRLGSTHADAAGTTSQGHGLTSSRLSPLSGFTGVPPEASPPDALGAPIVEQMVTVLAKQIGPVARVLAKRELQRMGTSPGTIGRQAYRDLVMLLARHVAEPNRAHDFYSSALRLAER
jgi:hypothetical protein